MDAHLADRDAVTLDGAGATVDVEVNDHHGFSATAEREATCTDADGDACTSSWEASSGGTYTGASAEHRFTQGGNFVIVLQVSDDGYPPLTSQQTFQIAASDDTAGREIMRGGCACAASPSGWAWLLAGVVVVRWRRRR